jgi:hypothetical protein
MGLNLRGRNFMGLNLRGRIFSALAVRAFDSPMAVSFTGFVVAFFSVDRLLINDFF